MDRSSFLSRLKRRAPGTAPHDAAEMPATTAEPAPPSAGSVTARPEPSPALSGRDALLALFIERALASGATASVVPTRRDAEAAVERLIAERGWRSVACAAAAAWPGLEASRASDAQDARDAAFGLTVAGWGVAETGSLLIRTGPDVNRGDSILPPVTGFIVSGDRILPTLGDALRLLDREHGGDRQGDLEPGDVQRDAAQPGDVPSCFTFVTGPSGTGDLVGQHVIGAHGPAEVLIWVIDERAGRDAAAGRPDPSSDDGATR